MSEEYDLTPVPVEEHANILFTEDSNKNIGDHINNIEENLISFFKGGLYKVAKDNDVKTPDWMQSAHDFLNNPDLNTAVGVTSPMSKVPRTPVMDKIDNLLEKGRESLPKDIATSEALKSVTKTSKSKYTPEQIEKFEGLVKSGKTYEEIADEMDITRGAVAGLANRQGLKRGESPNPEGRGVAPVNYEHTWSTREMAAARKWDPSTALPEDLVRRGVDQTMQKLEEINNRVDKRFGSSNNRSIAGDQSYEEGVIDYNNIIKRAGESKSRREGGIHYDRISEIKDLLNEGDSMASVARKLDIPEPSVRQLVRKNEELSSLRTSAPSTNWAAREDKLLTDWYNDPKSDLYGTPKGLEHRSPASIERRIKTLGLGKEE